MSAGRPTKYDKKYCEELIEHMAKGLSYEAFAGTVSVSKQTLYDWEKANPEFLDAKEIAIEKCRIFWEELGIKNIINKSDSSSWEGGSESKSRSLNSSAWIFNMKNRFGWRDKQPGEEDKIITPPSKDQLDERINELLEKLNGSNGE